MTYTLPQEIKNYVNTLDDLAHERLLTSKLVPGATFISEFHVAYREDPLAGCLMGVAHGVPSAMLASRYYPRTSWDKFLGQEMHDSLARDRIWGTFDRECEQNGYGAEPVQQAIRDHIVQLRLARTPVAEPRMVGAGSSGVRALA